MNRKEDFQEIDKSILLDIISIQNEVVQAGLDLDRIIFLVAQSSQALIKAEGAVVELKEDNVLVYRATSGVAEKMLGLRIPLESSLSGLCVTENRPILCRDSESDERVDREACRRVGLRSMIVVPLLYHNSPVGVLKVLSSRNNCFTMLDAKILNMLSDIISAAIVTAEKLGKNALYIASTTDRMTGVKNRSFFYDVLRSDFISSQTSGASFSLLVLDMDNLKKINDTLGHSYGDASIIETASRIKKVLRENDIFSRLGGDEFGVIFRSIDNREGVERLTGRIQDSVTARFLFEEREIPLSISIGYALLKEGFRSIEEMLHLADKRMYRNKKMKKNRRL